MSEFNIFSLIKAKKKLVLISTLIFVVLGMGLSLIQPLRYSSSLRLLVVQKAGVTYDPYAMSKSTDYLSQLLAKVAYSNLFFGRVLASDLSIDGSYFGNGIKARAKEWGRTINVKSVKETGIISIEAYQPNREQAEKIARAVALTLMTQHANYHGMGEGVMIRLLDEPITSNYPDQPNLLLNFLVSLVAGLAFGVAWAYLQAPSQRHQQSVMSHQPYQETEESWEEPMTEEAESYPAEPAPASFPWQQSQ